MAAITWTGAAGDGNFNNPANWSPAQVPGGSDTVTISPSAVSLININNTADAVQALKMSSKVTLAINDNSSLTVGNAATNNATLSNAGTIEINADNYTTSLIIGGPEVTLSGSGTILMNNSGSNQITSASDSNILDNTGNLIEGAGNLGGGTLTYINGAGSVVNANDSAYLYLNTGASTVTNAGLLEATAGGGLRIMSSVNNGTTGHITAAGATVYIESGADIAGGTLASTGSSVIADNNSATLDGSTNALTSTATVAIQDDTTLTLLGSIVNSGQIVLEHDNYNTDLVIGPSGTKAGTVTLSGTGTIVLGDSGSGNRIYGAMAGDTLVNLSNTISGAGQLGTGTLSLINDATINANGANALYLNTGVTATNNSLIEATGGGGLYIQSAVNSSGGGTILAKNANVMLNGGTLAGGLVTSTGTGAVYVQGSGTLDGSAQTVTNTGLVYVEDNSALSALGTITNTGTISLNADNYNSDLLAAGATVTLTGGGTILLNTDSNNLITAGTAGDSLVNVNNTIEGAAQLGDGTLTFINGKAGIVNANNAGALVLNTGAVAAVNMGLLESSAGSGDLYIETAVNSSGGGTILANNGNVILYGGTLAGGLVTSTGTGAVYVQGSATLDGSAQTVTNTGLVYVEDNAALSLLGTITNTGTISLNANNYYSDLLAAGATVTLTGGGTILMDSDSNNLITASAAGNALVNVNNLIEGAGNIGDGTLTFTNAAAGVIDANASAYLYINTGTVAVTNMGLLEASAGSGGLVIQSNITNTGKIAAAGGNVFLQSGADIVGGTLTSSGAGSILVSNSATLGSVGGTITNTGTVALQDGTTLSLLGTVLNDHVIAIENDNYNTDLVIGSSKTGTTTLSGGGTVSLNSGGGNRIYAALSGDTLLNMNNTITGAGQFGVGAGSNTLVLINDGTISASTGGALTIDTGAVVTNNALIEATGGSNLYIDDVIANSGGGTILAASGNVLLNGGTVQGGLVNSAAGFAVVDLNSATLDGSGKHSVTNKGLVTINDGSNLTLLGTITNDGTIALNADNYDTNLILGAATVTLTGGGTISLDNSGANRIYGAAGTDTLVNVNNTITGAGQLGVGQMILINEASGIIDASQTSTLNLTSATGGTITNAGLIESTSSGGLIVQTVINSSTGGTILANGGNVYLNSSGSLEGGVIASGANGGIFDVNGAFTLDGSAQTLTNTTTVEVNDGQVLTLLGTITNHGTIGLNADNYNTDLVAGAATVTLTGAGTILMNDSGANRIYGAAGSDVLINVNNLIEGAGQIGAGQLTLINQAAGIIDANDGAGITLNTGSTVTNAGLIEATGAGGLSIQSVVNSSTGGTILAAGGNVYLGGGTLQGGLIKSSGGGAFYVNGAATLDGSAHTLTSDATVNVDDGQVLTLLGTIANNGTVSINSDNYNTDVMIGSPTVTLTGTGTIQLNGGGARLYGASAANVLDNVSNLIGGDGQLGVGQLTLVNAGIIDANVGGNTLSVNLGSTGMNTATGTMLASGGGVLSLANGTYTNLGLYEAADGSLLTFQSNATLTNDNNGTLTGGTYSAIDAGNGATVSITGSAVTTLDAAIVLSGAHSTVEFGGTAIDSSLAVIGATGSLSILNDRLFTDTGNGGTLTDNGMILLRGGVFTDNQLIIGKGGAFSGFGTLAGPISNSGTIDAIGGKLILEGKVSGTGTIIAGTGGTIDLGGGGTITQPISGTGTLELGGGTFTIADANVTIATLAVDAKTTLIGTGTVTSQTIDNGTITANTGTLGLQGGVTGSGTLSANASSVLIVGGTSMFGGVIGGAGEVELTGPTTLLSGISLQAADIEQSAMVSLAGGVSVTNLAGHIYSLDKVGTNDHTPHRAEVQLNGAQGDVFTNAGTLTSDTAALIGVDFVNTGVVSDTVGVLTISGSLSGMGGVTLGNRGTVNLTGGATYGGTFSGGGTLDIASVVTLEAGASLGAGTTVDTVLLILNTGEAVRIGGGNVFTLADGGGNTPHRAEVEVRGQGSSSFTNASMVTSTATDGVFSVKFVNNGLTVASAGTLSFLNATSNGGTFDATGGAEISIAANVTGTGALKIDTGSTFALLNGAAAGQTVDFLASSGALDLGNPLNFAGMIAGFGGSDVIDLLNTASTSETFAAGVLTVQDNGATVASLHFAGSYNTGDFMLKSDGNGGTNITFV